MNYFQNDNISFGSALVNSCFLETQAKYPRIIIQKQIVEEFLQRDYENRSFSRLIQIIHPENSGEYDLKAIYEATNNIINTLGFFHCETLCNDASEILTFLLSIMSNVDSNTFELFINRFDNLARKLLELEKKYCNLARKSTTCFLKDLLTIFNETEDFYTLNPFEKNTSFLFIAYSNNSTPSRFMKYSDGSFGVPIMFDNDGNLMYRLTINEFMIHREDSIEELNKIKLIIISRIKNHSNSVLINNEVLSKYVWLKDFFNSHCNEILKRNFITQNEYLSLIIK